MNYDYELVFFDQVGKDGSIGKPKSFAKEIAYFYEKGDVEIRVRKKRGKRSLLQNNLYWAYCTLIGEHTGYTKDETDSIIGYKFRRMQKVDDKTGEVFEYIRSTTKMNKLQMADHCEEIQKWCEATFGFRLPVPGETWEITFT
jgi:hypothetical protein